MADVSPSLVEAAARAITFAMSIPAAGPLDSDDYARLFATSVIAAVGDALRLEGAQAENARLQPIQQAKYAQGREQGRLEGAQAERERIERQQRALLDRVVRDYGVGSHSDVAAAMLAEIDLAALGGVHPEASDG